MGKGAAAAPHDRIAALVERVQALDAGQYPIERLVAWARRRAQEAQP
jgi:hypothetical protein